MATEVVMPKFGMTMVEGTLKEWLAPDGSTVTAGQPIFRLETEKVNFEAEAEIDGVLRHAVIAGTVVPTGAAVGYLLAPGESAPAGLTLTPSSGASAAAGANGAAVSGIANRAPGGWVRASPAARRLARELAVDLALVPASAGGIVHEAEVRAFKEHAGAQPAVGTEPSVAEVRASPLARRLAEQHGIDLATVRGSGPGGRIIQEDVERLVAAGAVPRPAAPPSAPAPVAALGAPMPGSTVPFTGIRRTIAQRMHTSLQEMAQLTITTEADVTELVRLRAQLIEEWQGEGVRPGYVDFTIKASAKALRAHPRVNASLDGEVIRLHDHVGVGMAVALDDGLIVPVIHDADRLPLKRIARQSTDLAERARAGRLGYDDVTGGTFSVTSLGAHGVDAFTPIVNPPQAAILGIGRVRDAVALAGREVIARQGLTLSLSFDHRILDGAPAAEFLGRIRHLLERPYLLLIEDE